MRARGLARAGERLAALEYASRGYEIVARNWRSRSGELDLVVVRGNELVFCEVKTRSSLGTGLPEEAVSRSKQKRIRDLAAEFMRAERITGRLDCDLNVRFDVAAVIVTGRAGPEVRLFEDAF